jgi:hypothetical protein
MCDRDDVRGGARSVQAEELMGQSGMRAKLALLDERRFSNGVVHLRYRPL